MLARSLVTAAVVLLWPAAGFTHGPGAVAAADRDDGGTLLGFGLGPAARLSGPLAGHVAPDGVSGRVRYGLRVARLGLELDLGITPLARPGFDSATLFLATPTLAVYLLAHRHAQLAVRGGLGWGAITSQRTGAAPPCLEAPCAGPTRETVSQPAYDLDLGVTGSLHLGRRRGGRAILWADLGLSLVRVQLPGEVVGGRLVTFTVGIAHGIAM